MRRILMIPASGPKGTGEFFRSWNIARYLRAHLPNVEFHFLLHRNSAGAKLCDFPKTLLNDTPTYCTEEVAEKLNSWQADVVVFDATGRSSQIKLAKNTGAKTVFIAQNRRLLSRGLGIKRLNQTDEVWVAQPEFMLPLTALDRLKVRLSLVQITHIGPVFPLLSKQDIASAQEKYSILADDYILVNPGGGGHLHNGEPVAHRFEQMALAAHQQSGLPVVLIYGPNYTGQPLKKDGIVALMAVDPTVFNAAISNARAFISGGGGALFQSSAYGIPTIAIPISPDQKKRIKALADSDAVVEGSFDISQLSDLLEPLLRNTGTKPQNSDSSPALERVLVRMQGLLK